MKKKSFNVYEANSGRKLGTVDGLNNKDAQKKASKRFKNKTVSVR